MLSTVDGVYDADVEWRGMIREDITALLAANFPVKPPRQWFSDPQLKGITPLTIDNAGRVYGHIAAWHTSHIGMAGGVKPPKSKSNYAFFRTGVVETDSGDFVDVGQITLAGGHAPLEATAARAVAHYDDTNSAIMDVAAGEDAYGIWVAGALRPDVSEAQVRAIRASSVSGDWRPINGRLELVAVCAVNCPGFPIPRARVASGAPIALVAAGVEPIIEKALEDRMGANIQAGIEQGLSMFRDRIVHLESAIIAMGGEQESAPSADPRAEQLRRRVRGEAESPSDDRIAQLRARVRPVEAAPAEITPDEVVDTTWDDGLDVSVPIAAALRAKVHA